MDITKPKQKKHHSWKNPTDSNKWVRRLKKAWWFIWYDDSATSWLVNIILAFVLIKYIVYPGLGILFGTNFPIVAVVSGSMEHKITPDDNGRLHICGEFFEEKERMDFDRFWELCGDWYRDKNINKLMFEEFPFSNGFNKGDIMVLFGTPAEDIKVGDVIVFDSRKPYPIIHRTVAIRNEEKIYFETKGDHNAKQVQDSMLNERAVPETTYLGKAVLRIPYLGYIKIWFVEFISDPLMRVIRG